MSRRLIGERVVVKIQSCPQRDGVLISGVKKPSKVIQKFPVRFPNGDVRTYRGDQLLLRGSQAPLLEYIRVGDIIFTKKTLGVVRFIGLHEDFVGTVIVIEPIDPKLPTDTTVASFHKLFPSANLADSRDYNIIRNVEEILKVLPPDCLLEQLSKIKDKYLAFVEDTRESDRVFEEDMSKRAKKIAELENEIREMENKDVEDHSETGAVPPENNDEVNMTKIVFHPGKLGIKANWKTGEVEEISENGQAEKFGLEVGWKIVKINDEDYSEELLDEKTAGQSDYTITFHIPIQTKSHTLDTEVPAAKDTNITNPLYTETEREKYERQIHELNDQIEDFQYAIEALQVKNTNMEEEHKELPKLRSKVDQLRNSKQMFIGQIKEVQKREKEWKQKAEENEQKYNKLLAELKSGGNVQSMNKEDALLNKKDRGRGGARHGRKGSMQMPQPDSANTLSIGSQPTPHIGAGSAQTVSMSSLNTNTDDKDSSNGKKSKKKPRFPGW
jgi:hypothetical protein